MKILLTGANGYIGMRLLPQLLDAGHEVICAVRDPKRLSVTDDLLERIKVITIDFSDIQKPKPFQTMSTQPTIYCIPCLQLKEILKN